VGAFFVAPACFAAVLLVASTGPAAVGIARGLAWDTVRFLGLSGLAFGSAWIIGKAIPEELVAVAVASLFGCVAYGAGLGIVARRQVQVLLGVLARPAAA
jgi:hypothetical protein